MTKKSIQLISNTLFMYIRMYSISGMLTTATRRVPLADKDFPNVPKRLNSPPPLFFCRIRVTRSLVLCVCFVDRCLSFCTFSFGHCIVCSSSTNGFWLPLCYLLAIVLSVLLRQTDSDYTCGTFWPLCCLFFFDKRILITPVVSFGHCVVCSSSTNGFWLPLRYLLAIVLSVLLRYTDSDYPLGIFKLFLHFCGIYVAQYLVFSVVFCRSLFVLFILAITLYILLWLTASVYHFWHLQTFLTSSARMS